MFQIKINYMLNLKIKIREIPDFPKKGVNFKDITPLLSDSKYFKQVIDLFYKEFKKLKPVKIVAIDARGFLLASALAYKLGVGIVIARKKGKLPHKTIACEYDLEYGKEILEIHNDSIKKGECVLIIDDVLATGGTALAVAKLAEKLKAKIVGFGFLIELKLLNGREKLKKYKISSLIEY